jgi:hypothetical protein
MGSEATNVIYDLLFSIDDCSVSSVAHSIYDWWGRAATLRIGVHQRPSAVSIGNLFLLDFFVHLLYCGATEHFPH